MHAIAPLIPVCLFQIELEIHQPGQIIHELLSDGKVSQPSWQGWIGIHLTILGLLGIGLTGPTGWGWGGSIGNWLTGSTSWGSVMLLGTWPIFFFSFLTIMYLYDHMTPTHMTAYLYNRAILSGTPLFPSYGSL